MPGNSWFEETDSGWGGVVICVYARRKSAVMQRGKKSYVNRILYSSSSSIANNNIGCTRSSTIVTLHTPTINLETGKWSFT